MKIILIALGILLTILFAYSQNEKFEKEQYTLIKKIENIEIRCYNESVNASYFSDSVSQRNSYFKYLASYIFGENSENKKISMTSPVTMRLYGNNEMIFRMPSEYSLESLPKSNNPKINFFKTAGCNKAAISYGGYSNIKIETKKINQLKEVLLKNNIEHTGEFDVLVYNAPYKILNRRNEITVNITYP